MNTEAVETSNLAPSWPWRFHMSLLNLSAPTPTPNLWLRFHIFSVRTFTQTSVWYLDLSMKGSFPIPSNSSLTNDPITDSILVRSKIRSRSALEPTQPPVKWVPVSFPGTKRPGRGVNHPSLSSSLWAFMGCSSANFTFSVRYRKDHKINSVCISIYI